MEAASSVELSVLQGSRGMGARTVFQVLLCSLPRPGLEECLARGVRSPGVVVQTSRVALSTSLEFASRMPCFVSASASH